LIKILTQRPEERQNQVNPARNMLVHRGLIACQFPEEHRRGVDKGETQRTPGKALQQAWQQAWQMEAGMARLALPMCLPMVRAGTMIALVPRMPMSSMMPVMHLLVLLLWLLPRWLLLVL